MRMAASKKGKSGNLGICSDPLCEENTLQGSIKHNRTGYFGCGDV